MARAASTPSILRASKLCAIGSTDSGTKPWPPSSRQPSANSIHPGVEMSEQGPFDPNSIRKAIDVHAAQETAWRVFTEKMGAWWPLAYYKIGKANAIDAVIEPYRGGRWYERGDDGTTCDWGTVLAWEPYSRLVLSWDISADWQPDPALKTEIEVRFVPSGENATRVELEH